MGASAGAFIRHSALRFPGMNVDLQSGTSIWALWQRRAFFNFLMLCLVVLGSQLCWSRGRTSCALRAQKYQNRLAGGDHRDLFPR